MLYRVTLVVGLLLSLTGCVGSANIAVSTVVKPTGNTPVPAPSAPGIAAVAATATVLVPSQIATATVLIPRQTGRAAPAVEPATTNAAEATLAVTARPFVPSPQPTKVTATPTTSGLPDFSHVFVIIMENKEATQVVGNPSAPYLNSLAVQYARASAFYAIRHPSLPNYLALTGGSTFGITDDCTDCFIAASNNIVTQLEAAGRPWKAYMEAMPQPCYQGPDTDLYAQRHNPFVYYDNVRTNPSRCQNIVPLAQLGPDIQKGSLADYVWITPDTCNDMHDCSIATGDKWLQMWAPKILATSAWRNGGVLFVTFDEGATNNGCCGLAAGGKVDTLVVSPLVKPGFVSGVNYDHYSLLRTIEQAWGLPLLGNAGAASTTAMTDFFQSEP